MALIFARDLADVTLVDVLVVIIVSRIGPCGRRFFRKFRHSPKIYKTCPQKKAGSW